MLSNISKNAPFKNNAIESYKNVLEIISQSTDDFLFLMDIEKDEFWFFGPIDRNYALRDEGSFINTTAQMVEITHPGDRKTLIKDLDEIKKGIKDFQNLDYRWINRRSQIVWINCRGKVIKDENGKPFVMIGRVSEEAMRHLFNPLTGLFNQIKLMRDLKEILPVQKQGYIMLVDIDDLSAINLSHGRAYGDSLLKFLAQNLDELPSAKKVYHTERNYFAVYLDAKTQQEVEKIYADIQEFMQDKCTVTAGVVPLDGSVFIDENNLYDSVKIILRKAKNKGKNSIEFFSKEEIQQKVSSVELLEELHESINNNYEGFYINYQPQVKAGNYLLYSAEALVRYKSKAGEKIFPNDFIPLLEQSGLIVNVGSWVLEQALLQCKKWRKVKNNMRISVNFSIIQFRDENIVESIFKLLEKTNMPGDALTIEITESVPIHEIDRFTDIIKQLKSSGIQLAIDDFGTGYSNMGYLKQLDIDEIKIDRMFVKDIEKDTYNYNVISNALDFAKMNAIRVCCEGVETTRELTVLESRSPDLIQGYLFDKPCDPSIFESTYINSESPKFKEREEFIDNLHNYKEKMSMIRIDPKNILRETNVGLWIIRINQKDNYFEMHADETMERIMAVDKKYTPQECYNFWYSRIRKDYTDYVQKNVRLMTELDKVVQLEYPWIHPDLGEVIIRCNGRRVEDSDGMLVLEGYHRILSNIKEV